MKIFPLVTIHSDVANWDLVKVSITPLRPLVRDLYGITHYYFSSVPGVKVLYLLGEYVRKGKDNVAVGTEKSTQALEERNYCINGDIQFSFNYCTFVVSFSSEGMFLYSIVIA